MTSSDKEKKTTYSDEKEAVRLLFSAEEVEVDNTFLYADIVHNEKENVYAIFIKTDNFKCSMDGGKDKPSVFELRDRTQEPLEDNNTKTYSKQLVSAGMLLQINNRSVVIERDNGARIDPNKFQFPAGRCS